MIHETGKDDTNHRLIHIVPKNGSFDDGTRQFGSRFIEREIYIHFKNNWMDRLQVFFSDISELPKNNTLGTLYGRMFENHALCCIENGEILKRRNLVTQEITDFKNEIVKTEYFDSIKELKPTVGTVYVSKSAIFTAIDFLTYDAKNFAAFNATTNSKHELILESLNGKSGLYRVCADLPNHTLKLDINDGKHSGLFSKKSGEKSIVEFNFVVPEKYFNDFKKPPTLNWKYKTSSLSDRMKSTFENCINFYVISIPKPKNVRQFHTIARRIFRK